MLRIMIVSGAFAERFPEYGMPFQAMLLAVSETLPFPLDIRSLIWEYFPKF